MAKLYRKSLLEKMSSPDQLDKAIVITPPSFWIAVTGGIIIIAVALVWSLTGTIPEKVDTNGIYIYDQDAYVVSSEVNGIVEDVKVEVGDVVSEGDVLYTIDSESVEKELESLKQRLNDINKITLTSKNDVANQDSQNILSYKAQYISASNNSASAAYDVALEKYEECEDAASKAKTKAENAYKEYATALAQVNEASATNYNQQLSEQESLISCLQIEALYYEEAYEYWTNYVEYVDDYVEEIDKYTNGTDEEKIEASTFIQQFEQQMNAKAADIQIAYTSASDAAIKIGRTIEDDYKPSIIQNSGFIENSSAATLKAGAEAKLNEANGLLSAAQSEYANIKATMASDPTYSGNSNLASLKSVYDSAVSDYQTKAQLATSAEQTLFSYETNKASGEASTKSQSEAYRTQFVAAKGALVDQFEDQIEKYEEQIKQNSVVSNMSGIITNLAVSKGQTVTQGSSTVVIRQKQDTQEVILYVSITDGKKIEEGMDVNIYPTTVNRSEYGHMIATVKNVAEYITTDQEIFNKIGDKNLASMFTQNGSVIEIVCELEKDETSLNGYAWSTAKGKTVSLKESTVVTAEIITNEQHPISILIPYLKDKMENLTSEEK